MKKTYRNVFQNNYVMAIISIILIVLIVAISLNFRPKQNDTAGQAYLQEIQDGVLQVKSSPAMTKIYVESSPEAYAYLRNQVRDK